MIGGKYNLVQRLIRAEAYEHCLGQQLYPELISHARLNLVLQRDDLRRCGSATVNDGQGMLTRDAGSPFAIAFGESGVLDQPRRRKLAEAVARRVAGELP